MMQKRDAPELFRVLKKKALAPVYRWSLQEGKIVGGEELRVAPGETAP
jgi:hypothetical protein